MHIYDGLMNYKLFFLNFYNLMMVNISSSAKCILAIIGVQFFAAVIIIFWLCK